MTRGGWPRGKRRSISSARAGAIQAERRRQLEAVSNPAPMTVTFVCPVCKGPHPFSEHGDTTQSTTPRSPKRKPRKPVGQFEYRDYMNSAAWEAVKRRYRNSTLPQKCLVCGNSQVHLHHRSYDRLGRERLNDLVPLCQEHHRGVHDFAKAHPSWSLWRSTTTYVKRNSRSSRKHA